MSLIIILSIVAAGALVSGLSFSFGVQAAMTAMRDGAERRMSPSDFCKFEKLLYIALEENDEYEVNL